MKKIYLLFLISSVIKAQVPNNTTPKYLDKNYVKARINTVNNKFWNIYGNGNNAYEVPKGKGASAQFANCLWIGGYDSNGLLHVSANTYRQTGTDFWPGPLDTANIAAFSASNTTVYNKLWKVDCDDINNFMIAYSNGLVSNGTYTVPADIVNYPAYGIANFRKKLEPFKDINNNGVYYPVVEGDYPIIKGHQQILSIYNDNFTTHGETNGLPMGLEIHERSYAYFDPTLPDSMQAVNYSTFYHYTIYNRSNEKYTNVFISDWSDVDLGYYGDDYIGSDTINNFTYCYNADNFDDPSFGMPGYGNKPPVVSHAILKTDCTSDGIDNNLNGQTDEPGEQFLMNRSTYYNNNMNPFPYATTNPDSTIHFYRYMAGYWKNNTPFTFGGNAFGGTTPSKFVFPGNPATNTGWTGATASISPGDARVLTTSGPFTLPANSRFEWGFAVVYSQDTSQAVNTITQFNTRVQRDVRNVRYYDQQHQQPLCTPALTITTNIKELKGASLNGVVYPNPAQNKFTISLNDKINDATITLSDLSGKTVKNVRATNFSEFTMDISDLQSGVYFVEVKSDNRKLVQKIIKLN